MTMSTDDNRDVRAQNLDRMVVRGERLETMPAKLREQIRARLHREATMSKAFRFARGFRLRGLSLVQRPMLTAATAILVITMITVFWPRQQVSAVSWSAVAAHFQSARSVVVYGTVQTGNTCTAEKAYFRDAGRMRVEVYRAHRGVLGLGSCVIAPADFLPGNLLSTMILSTPPGGERQLLTLFPESRSALLRPLHGGRSQSPSVASICQQLAKVREGATRRLDDRTFDGIQLAGFETSVDVFDAALRDGFVRVWVEPVTAVPRRVELAFNRVARSTGPDLDMTYRSTMFRFDWNAEFPDNLLDLRAPEGWSVGHGSERATTPTGR
jgi:hypothetical protein